MTRIYWSSVRSDAESGTVVGELGGMLIADVGMGKVVPVAPESVREREEVEP